MAIEKTINIDVNSKKAQKDVKNLEKAVEGVNKEVKETSASTEAMGGVLDNVTGGAVSKFNGLKGSLTGVVKSFKSLRVAIIATGIGALLIAITAVGQAFTRSEEGQNKFAKILAVIGSVVDNLLDLLADLGENIISVFENPKQALKDFAKLIKENIVNRFEGLLELIPNLGKAVSLLFKGEFSAAGKVAADAVGKVTLGVDSITDSVGEAVEKVKEFGKEVASDAENATKIADARAKAEKMARNLIVERAEAERKIAEIREKAADKENFTAAERIQLLKEAGAISEDLANKETEVAKLRLDAKVLENSLAKSNKQALDEEAQLKADLINKETQRLKLQKALTAEVTTAIREEAAEVKAAEATIKATKDKQAADEKLRLDAIQKIRDEFKIKEEDKEAETELQKVNLAEQRQLAELEKLEATEEQKQAIRDYYAGLRNDLNAQSSKNEIVWSELTEGEKLKIVSQSFKDLSKILGEESAAGKAAAIAAATIDTYTSATSSYNALSGIPIVGPVLGALAAGAAVASGIANVQKIKSTKVPGGGGGGGATPSASKPSQAAAPPQFNVVGTTETSQLAEAIGGQTQEPVQAFVVANDVTTAQSLENNIVEGATL